MERLIIDRFEGKFAICEKEDRSHIQISIAQIPSDLKEGDCLLLYNSGKIVKDEDRTKSRKERITSLMEQLRRNE